MGWIVWANAWGKAKSLGTEGSGIAGAQAFVLLVILLGAYAYTVLTNDNLNLSRLRVNYAGGFVRRGLLGEIAFLLHPWIDSRVFLAATYHVLYAGAAYLTMRLLMATVSSKFFLLLIYFSPAAFLFPVADTGALYRSDIVAISVFVLHARFPQINRGMLAVLLVTSMLVHELQLFFLPFHASLLILRKKRIWPLLPAVVAAFLVAGHTGESEAVRRAICNSWGGIDCPQLLDWGIERSFLASLSALEASGIGYFCGLILALLPLAIMVSGSRGWSPKHSLLALLSCASGALLFLAGVDYGRWVSLIALHATIFVACGGVIFRCSLPMHVEEKIAIAFLYIFLWRVPHISTDGILRGKLYVYLSNAPYGDVWYWALLPIGAAPLFLLMAVLVKRRQKIC